MANSLLDFVMSVVRDPDVAAQYAADPAQAISAANLTDVTSADVNSLIPVVTESLSAAPVSGFDAIGDAGNVWSSGAATAAFDAFDDHLPLQGIDDSPVVRDLIAQPDGAAPGVVDTAWDDWDGGLNTVATANDPGLAFDAAVIDDGTVAEGLDALDDWTQPAGGDGTVDTPNADPQGFDAFN